MFGASSEPASVMEFGFKFRRRVYYSGLALDSDHVMKRCGPKLREYSTRVSSACMLRSGFRLSVTYRCCIKTTEKSGPSLYSYT